MECLLREIAEEMDVRLDPAAVALVCTRLRPWGMLEHTFMTDLDLDLDRIVLTEGQGLAWFREDDIATVALGFDEYGLLSAFFAELRGEPGTDRAPGAQQERSG